MKTKINGAAAPATAASGGARQELLDTTAESAGQTWATLRCDELSSEGRLAKGGWPGTIAEARARVAVAITGALRERGMLAHSHAELGRASHVAYEAARRSWLNAARLVSQNRIDNDDDDSDD